MWDVARSKRNTGISRKKQIGGIKKYVIHCKIRPFNYPNNSQDC